MSTDTKSMNTKTPKVVRYQHHLVDEASPMLPVGSKPREGSAYARFSAFGPEYVLADDYDCIANLLRNVMNSGCFKAEDASAKALETNVLQELEYARYAANKKAGTSTEPCTDANGSQHTHVFDQVMDWREAYPASSGAKCICGAARLGWLGNVSDMDNLKAAPKVKDDLRILWA